jgi:hypothetical protein
LPVTAIQHNNGGHGTYNTIIKNKLDQLWIQYGSNIDPTTAASLIRGLAADIKAWIVAHPNESINNIVL